mgnify:CR=1 FL=1
MNNVPPIGVIIPKYDNLYIDIKYKEPEKRIIPQIIKYATIFKSTENVFAIIPIKIRPRAWNIWYCTAVLNTSILSAIIFAKACAPKAPIAIEKIENIIPDLIIHIIYFFQK